MAVDVECALVQLVDQLALVDRGFGLEQLVVVSRHDIISGADCHRAVQLGQVLPEVSLGHGPGLGFAAAAQHPFSFRLVAAFYQLQYVQPASRELGGRKLVLPDYPLLYLGVHDLVVVVQDVNFFQLF